MLIVSQNEHQAAEKNTVTIAVFSQCDKILLLQRNPQADIAYIDPFGNSWELIGGHVEVGEEPLVAAQREVLEETGIVPQAAFDLIGISPFTSRDIPANNWLYQVSLEKEVSVVISHEHLRYAWQPIEVALQMQLAFKHSHILEAIIQRRSL